MSATIPTCEPTQIRAGETTAWTRSLDDYPANDGWTLQYYLRGHSGSVVLGIIDFSSTPDGAAHLISLPFTTTADWDAGIYDAIGLAVSATERFQVYSGKIEVLPDFSQAEANYDPRTQARRTLDNINAVLEGRASSTILNSEVAGTKLERLTHEQLMKLRDYFKQEVIDEERKAGTGRSKTIFAQFSPPR